MSVWLLAASSTVFVTGADVAVPVLDADAESVAVSFADDSAEETTLVLRDVRSVDELRVERVSDMSRSGFVVDRPEPNVVRGLVPDAADPPVEPTDELGELDDETADSADELEKSDDELEDDCPPSSANAVPIPAVPTNPATPSEKATAPTRSAATRSATLAEFIAGPIPPPDRSPNDSSAAQPDVPEPVAALTAIPVPVVRIALRNLDVRTVDLAGIER
ncbi:hypothetical protein A5698_15145 [Mycobacterium sp. E136]|nr:hypothetical protein A5698_15145 [Mycobacterium sp. E136]